MQKNVFWANQCTSIFSKAHGVLFMQPPSQLVHHPFVDDIIIFLKTSKEHRQRLRGMFVKLSKAGLKLKPSKCEFFRTS